MSRVGIATPAGEVDVLLDGPRGAETIAFLAHGAGADMRSDFMSFMALRLSELGLRVCRFNFPYAQQQRRAPDRQPLLEQAFRSVIAGVGREDHARVVLGGKSLGGRVASQIVAQGEPADALVFLGYPLHPPGRPERLRDAHLRAITVPMLFVEGTRDPFCPLPTLARVRATLPAPSDVAVIDGGDHSLKVPRSSGRTTEQAWEQAAEAVAAWIVKLPV